MQKQPSPSARGLPGARVRCPRPLPQPRVPPPEPPQFRPLNHPRSTPGTPQRSADSTPLYWSQRTWEEYQKLHRTIEKRRLVGSVRSREGAGKGRREAPGRLTRPSWSCWRPTAGGSACARALRLLARSTRPPFGPCGSSTPPTRSVGSHRFPQSTGWSSRPSRATDLRDGCTSSPDSARTVCSVPPGATEKSGSSSIRHPPPIRVPDYHYLRGNLGCRPLDQEATLAG